MAVAHSAELHGDTRVVAERLLRLRKQLACEGLISSRHGGLEQEQASCELGRQRERAQRGSRRHGGKDQSGKHLAARLGTLRPDGEVWLRARSAAAVTAARDRREVGDPGSRCAGCQVWYKNLDQITYAKLKLGQTGMQATYALVSPNVVRWITTLPF